ncbi:MAG: hypothetical protein JXD19_05085 [Deltaproteobacteria bacterium]|nr:hypothetical protein [Deltaproteobacteria bacterium]
MEQIQIEDRNLQRLRKDIFPPGISNKKAMTNYALSLGLDALEHHQLPQDHAQENARRHNSVPDDLKGVQNQPAQSVAV